MMSRIFRKVLAGAGLLLAGCNAKQDDPQVFIPANRIAVIGHGGMGNPGINNPYQLNSFNGLINALDVYRLDGVETDIQLSRDSTLFMIHDDYLELLSFCSGCIAAADSAFISGCSFRPVSSGQFRTDPVTPLERLFSLVASRRNRAKVFLDVHPPNTCIPDAETQRVYNERLIRSLGRLLKRYPISDRVVIQSIDRDLLEQAHAWLPQVQIYLDYCRNLDDIEYARDHGYAGVGAQNSAFSAELVEAAHSAGLQVQLYDAGSQPDILNALGKMPDYFLADNLVLTQQIAETVNEGW